MTPLLAEQSVVSTLIVHAQWTRGGLWLWAESAEAWSASRPGSEPDHHPFAAPADDLIRRLRLDADAVETGEIELRLPTEPGSDRPQPSDRLRTRYGASALDLAAGADVDDDNDDAAAPAAAPPANDVADRASRLQPTRVPAVTLPPEQMIAVLLHLDVIASPSRTEYGHGLRYWFAVARLTVDLLVNQRFVPTLAQASTGWIEARWQPWLDDEDIRARVATLLHAAPPIARAGLPDGRDEPWRLLDDALRVFTDAMVRSELIRDDFIEVVDGRDPSADPHVAWLAGLLGPDAHVDPPATMAAAMLRGAREWISQLDDEAGRKSFRLGFELHEPPADADHAGDAEWRLTLHLVSVENPDERIDAESIWQAASTAAAVNGVRIDHPQEQLLRELARAGRIYDKVEAMLVDPTPTGLTLSTAEAYAFLQDTRLLLEESGVEIIAPAWWDDPSTRLGVRLVVQTDEAPPAGDRAADGGPADALGLQSLLQFEWRLAVGDSPLSLEEFERLARENAPLVQVDGRWVEIRSEDLQAARKLLARQSGGEMTLLEAMQLAYDAEGLDTNLPVLGVDASGWISSLLGEMDAAMPMVKTPETLHGELRPYQKVGLSWLAFLERFGFGACLADDMGLGKTVQLIALLLHERQIKPDVGPTLLVMPTSVIGNWSRELERFAPSLNVHVHHGVDRLSDQAFADAIAADDIDVVLTTYALVSRDFESLTLVKWRRLVLDEAQYVKNPPTKQATAIRNIPAARRIAMTGTPVENRLIELWSIMDFANPGYLGPPGEFRRRFALPIERRRNNERAQQLRQLVRPFILRRLKTDPDVVSDLPACVETKEFAVLTAEQAAQYQRIVDAMLQDVDQAEGVRRRGLVLAALVKLKQACDHPALLLRESHDASKPPALVNGDQLSNRSGKSRRLISMLEEVIAAGDSALIFTQFRQMGALLQAMIQHDLDTEALFMHGGTPAAKRQAIIDRFQDRDGTAPIFILSLRAGGVGLNLTAANHVFHFDRWWNPAVEKQATDRAFRIGQTRTVHVHKFVCSGTLEERIDEMIEQKTELAENIIGAGEDWLTQLSTTQLRDLLSLRQSALEGDS